MAWRGVVLGVAVVLLGVNAVGVPFPFAVVKLVVGLAGLLAAGFLMAAAVPHRPRSAWVVAGALVLFLFVPGVPYREKACSDVPDPSTNAFCELRGTTTHPFGWVLLQGRSYGHGDLSHTSWTAPWWAGALAAAWAAAFLALAWGSRPREKP